MIYWAIETVRNSDGKSLLVYRWPVKSFRGELLLFRFRTDALTKIRSHDILCPRGWELKPVKMNLTRCKTKGGTR